MEIYLVDGIEINISSYTPAEKEAFFKKHKNAIKKEVEEPPKAKVDYSKKDISLDSSIEDINLNKEDAKESFYRKKLGEDYDEGIKVKDTKEDIKEREKFLHSTYIDADTFVMQDWVDAYKKKYGKEPSWQEKLKISNSLVGSSGATLDYFDEFKIGTEEEREKYPEYFNEDGSIKSKEEIKDIEATLESQEEKLIENPLYKTLAELDQKYDSAVMGKLDLENSRIAYESTVVNEDMKELDSISRNIFGRSIADLNTYNFTTQEEIDQANSLIKDAGANYKIIQSFQKDINSLATYYNNIENKNAQAEYAEGWEGVKNELKLGASNGRLNTALISYDLGRPVNMNDVEDTKEIISKIVKETKFQKGLLNSKEFAAFTAAGNADEFLSTEQFSLLMSSDAGLEIMASLVGNSLSQMITTGRYIVPGVIAAGTVKGAVLGSSFGPGGSVLGAVGGGLSGLNIGMALTNGAVEYGNSIFEAIREKGYDLENAQDVERALDDKEVWAEGRKIGISRAIPIMLVDYLGGKFAGDFVSPLASPTTRAAAILAESTILQPGIEALGEAAAQGSAYIVAGKEINLNEITMEALGGLGSKTPQLAGKVWYNSTDSYKKSLANKLAENLDFAVNQNSSERINTWADKMLKQKLIDEDTHKKIKTNAAIASETNTRFDNLKGEMSISEKALDKLKNGKKNKQIRDRIANLIQEEKDLLQIKKDTSKKGGKTTVITKALEHINNELNIIERTGSIENIEDSFKTREDLDALDYRQFALGKRILGKDGEGLGYRVIENLDPENTKNISKGALAQLAGGATAVNDGSVMIVNKAAEKLARDIYLEHGDTSALTAFSHEILHTVLANKFDTKEIQEISNNLQNYINDEFEKGSGIISGRVKARIDKRMAKYDKDPNYTKAAKAEEFLNVLSDEMASGAIKWENQNKGFWNNIAEKIKDTLYKFGLTEDEITSFDIKDGKDAFEFLKTYTKSFHKGQIRKRNLKKTQGTTVSSVPLSALAVEAKESGNLESPDLKNQYELLALEALGFQQGKGTVNRAEAVSFVNQYFPGIIRRYNPDIDKEGKITKDFSTFVFANIKPKRQKFYQEEIGDKAKTTSIDDKRSAQIVDKSEPTPTQPDVKVRKAKPFSNLKNLTEDVLVVLNSKINNVLSNIPLTKVSAEVVIDKIKNLVEKNLWKDIKEGMGTISKPGGVVTVSPEYKAYHDSNYKELVEAIPLSSAKRKYKSLFKIEKIGREKDKKVNPKTGKVTYPGTGIFNVTVPKKGAFGSYHTVQKPGMGINTLIERQTSLAKEVARGLAAEIVDTYIEENKTTLTKDMKVNEAIVLDNLFDQIKSSIDPNSNEQRKFDVVKATLPLTTTLDPLTLVEITEDFRDAVGSGIAPEAVAVLMSSQYNVPEDELQGMVGLINKVLAPFKRKINPKAYKQIADQEGVIKDQELQFDSGWNGYLKRMGLERYKSYKYNEKDPILRNKNKAKFEKSFVSYLEKLPDEVLNNQMFLQSLQNGYATTSFYANVKELQNVINKVKESRKNNPPPPPATIIGTDGKTVKINWKKVKFSDMVAKKLADLSNENFKNKMSNKDLVKAYNKILDKYGIDVKETKNALKYIMQSMNDFFHENNKSEAAGKFLVTWLKMQTHFSKGIFKGAGQFNSMSLTPSKTTFKTGSPTLRKQVAKEYNLTSDQVKYLNGSTGKMSVATQRGIKKGLEAKYSEKELKKLTADVKESMTVPKEFHGEHDIALMLFMTNVFGAITDGKFNSKYNDIARYYSQTLLNENHRMLIDKQWGKTGNTPDYYFGMMPEIRFTEVIPQIAKDIFMFEYGTTLDQVILNKLASKKVLNNKDLAKKLVVALKESISPKSLQVIKDNKSTVISDPSIRETYNTLISDTATEIYNETDNSVSQATAVELTTQIENKQEVKETQKENTKILNTTKVKSSIPLSSKESRFFWRKKILSTKPTKGRPLSPRNILMDISEGKSRFPLPSKMFDQDGKELTGLAKIKFQLEENAEILRLPTELKILESQRIYYQDIELNAQIKRVEELDMNAYADELRAEIKKAKGQYKEDLELALEEKYAPEWLADAVKTAGMDIKTGKFDTNQPKASIPLSTNNIINELKELDNEVEQKRNEVKASKPLSVSEEFNIILEETKGIKREYTYSLAKAKALGKRIGKWKFFIPPSAEDFKGLVYSFLGKGKVGDQQLDWFKETLFKPFARAIGNINNLKQTVSNDFKALKKQYPLIKKLLSKEIPTGGFTYDDAVRVYLWTNAGVEIPGLSKQDQKELYKEVKNNPELKAFSDKLNTIPKISESWIAPDAYWQVGNLSSDLNALTHNVARKKYLAEWIENKKEIFSEKNLNKIEALYGSNFREALEDILYRMEHGTNRTKGPGRLVNGFMDWVNNSIGTIMFFNSRSALLQQLSMTNFINWADNNIVKAAAAWANQPQFWADFSTLWNSDYLKQRRAGLKTNINEAEIASKVANSKNKVKAAISYLLKKGFLPTQLADSFAIATGGATMYRNRIKTYIKQGLSRVDAEAKAFQDFQEIAEETQQSSRPDLISQQQAGPLGRLLLAFQNTPMQYMRLSKKALLDLVNRRGDDKTNISKIIYYTAIQNLIFTSLQNALFASLLGDEDEDKTSNKKLRALNSSADTILKGMGIGGATVATLKNILVQFATQEDKDRPDHTYTVIEAANFSPPVGSKLRKLYQALQSYSYDKDQMYKKGLSLDNPAYLASGKVISAFTNIPLDRVFLKIENLRATTDSDLEKWQRISRFLGYSQWDINPPKKKSKRKSKGRSKIYIPKKRKKSKRPIA